MRLWNEFAILFDLIYAGVVLEFSGLLAKGSGEH